MYVKVCGLTETVHVDRAVECGYNAIGVVTYPKSRRYCSPERAMGLAQYAKGKIDTFVVGMTFVDVEAVSGDFDYVQIYEHRPLANLAYASGEKPLPTQPCRYFVYDASLGSGEFNAFPDWLNDIKGRLIVAGGLTPENVGPVIRRIRPFGVDVSSGVEKNGQKDSGLMKAFVDAVKNSA